LGGSKAKLALNGWGTVLKPAAFAGHLCFAPSLGTRVRFTRPDTWLKQRSRPLDPNGATAELTRRFLSAYAPATVHDFARWWGGASMKTVRGWLSGLGEEVAAVDLEGEQAWMLADDVREVRDLRSHDRTAGKAARVGSTCGRGGSRASCRILRLQRGPPAS